MTGRGAAEALLLAADWLDVADSIVAHATGKPLDPRRVVQTDLRALAHRLGTSPLVDAYLATALPGLPEETHP